MYMERSESALEEGQIIRFRALQAQNGGASSESRVALGHLPFLGQTQVENEQLPFHPILLFAAIALILCALTDGNAVMMLPLIPILRFLHLRFLHSCTLALFYDILDGVDLVRSTREQNRCKRNGNNLPSAHLTCQLHDFISHPISEIVQLQS